VKLHLKRDDTSQKADEHAEISIYKREKNQNAITFLRNFGLFDVKNLFLRPWIQCNDR